MQLRSNEIEEDEGIVTWFVEELWRQSDGATSERETDPDDDEEEPVQARHREADPDDDDEEPVQNLRREADPDDDDEEPVQNLRSAA